ncbi:winged helix-turn-helix transcriptional regulator [Natronorubrum sp. FCH18a]|uniref:winged helix-turn-helix transcriptional regulator n=1 Tax=Natronorubrum sp. FCH18a TaxID=3447018 RepID=UPI003F51989E
MSEHRLRIARRVHRQPGVHFNELVRTLELTPATVRDALDDLLEQGTIAVEELSGRTHYYPPSYDDWERRALAAFHRETAREILVYLYEHGQSRPNDVTTALDIARGTLEWHLETLLEWDLVEKRRDGSHVTLELASPEETIELLAIVEPDATDRFLDRASRLLDRFLEGG